MSLALLSIIDQVRGAWHPNCPPAEAVIHAVCHGLGMRAVDMFAERDTPARQARKWCIIALHELRPVMSQPEISRAVGLSRSSHSYVNKILQQHKNDPAMNAWSSQITLPTVA